MRRLFLTVLAVASLPLNPVVAQRPDNRGRDAAAVENGWLFDYEDALETARRTNRPLMVVFRCVP